MIQFQKARGEGSSGVSIIRGRSSARPARNGPVAELRKLSARVFTRWASTGATPSVPMATTRGSRSTIAGVMAVHSSGRSTMLTTRPQRRTFAASSASPSGSTSLAPMAR